MLQSAVMHYQKTAFDPQAVVIKAAVSQPNQATDRGFVVLLVVFALAVIVSYWARVTFRFPVSALIAVLAGSAFGAMAARWPFIYMRTYLRVCYGIVFKKQIQKEQHERKEP